MLLYCLKCRKNTESKKKQTRIAKKNKEKLMLLLKCIVCYSKT